LEHQWRHADRRHQQSAGPGNHQQRDVGFQPGLTGTYSGSIGGGCAVTVQGGSTVIFTGANTYFGGTTINGATLQLGNGGASGSIVGDVLDNGTFAINRYDSFTFGNTNPGPAPSCRPDRGRRS